MKHQRLSGALCAGVGLLALGASGAAAQDSGEEIVVVGYRAQNQQAVSAKRASETIADFLAADDIGSQPDYNISDAIRRVPGIQTIFDEDEGKFVSIRGLNPSYTLGALDGSTLATSERQNRQLNMEAIPSGAVRQVIATKARTPNIDGNAIGGTLNLVTRSPFDVDDFYLAGTAMFGLSTETTVPGEGFGRDYDDNPNARVDLTISNRFGSANQFGVLVGFNYLERNRDQQRLLPQQVPASITGTPAPAGTPSAAGAQTDLLWSNYPNTIWRIGGMLKLEWEPSPDLRTGVSLVHYRQDDNELRHSQRLRNGTGANASFVRFNDFPLEKPLTVAQAFADWTLDDNQTLAARASYSEAQFLEPSNQIQFNLTGAAATFDISTVAGGVPVATNLDPRLLVPANYALQNNRFLRYEDDSDEYVMEYALDYGFNTERSDMGWGFGAGVQWRRITRDNDRTDTTYIFAGAPLTLDRFLQPESYQPIYGNFSQLFVDTDGLLGYFAANPGSVTVQRDASVASDWVFEEDVAALYGLVRHAGDRHTIIFGGRFEDTQTTVERNRRTGVSPNFVDTRVTREGGYDHFLPSITATYDITDDLRLRAAAFQAIGRPNPSQLASGETVNQTTGAINRGNPDLRAREGDSYEASLEYYLPGGGGILAIGVFQKTVDNEIVTLLTPGAGPNGEDITQPINVSSAEVSGVELNAIINTLPLPGFLSNFGVSANATFIDGETTDQNGVTTDGLQGQSDFLANVALFYEQGPFRARAAYAFTDQYDTAAGRFDKATNTLDLQARYTFSDNFELIGEVRNATDENKVNYTSNNIYRDVSFYGRQFWLGATFSY
jgi:TonB-dependent receptor